MNTANTQGVGVHGDKVCIVLPKREMSKEEALRHAAWLVVMAGVVPGEAPDFAEIVAAVRNT